MGKIFPLLACLLHVFLGGCMDYVRIEEESMLGNTFHFPPSIDAKHISPHPSRLVESISVGKNCKGQVFKVPPISDRNKKDRLYYLWFIDNKLAWPQSIIEPDARDNAIVSLTIDQQFLLSHFETKLPTDFFNRPVLIEIIVSDLSFTIPESRYIDDAKANEKDHSDYVYWIATFSNDPC